VKNFWHFGQLIFGKINKSSIFLLKNDLNFCQNSKRCAMVTIICLRFMKHDAIMGFNVMMHVPKLPDFEECFLEIAIFWTICWSRFCQNIAGFFFFSFFFKNLDLRSLDDGPRPKKWQIQAKLKGC
jgi:hypothetical protein